MGVTLTRAATVAIHAHARQGYPHEVVGILAGDRATSRVDRAVTLVNENADRPRDRYLVTGLALYRAEEALAAEGAEVVGYYHSHPDHPAIASETDRDAALPAMAYVIVSVREGEVAETRCWRLRDDRSTMDEEPLTLEP